MRRIQFGFSLAELLVALTLFALVGGTIILVLRRQQRFYRDAADVLFTRQQVRDAISVVPASIIGISSVGGDIFAMSDSALDVRANIASAVLCAHDVRALVIPRVAPESLDPRSSFLVRPEIGDWAFVLDDSVPGVAGDRWQPVTVTGIDSAPDGCSRTPRIAAYRYEIDRALWETIADGAPVRFARRSKYSLYHSASDGAWWLGYRECMADGAVCGSIQPVSGPYLPYVAGDTLNSGVSFVYRDSTGAVTSVARSVARVDLFVNGETHGIIERGVIDERRREVMKITVALRNRH